jgi:thioredoxin 1
MVREINDSDFKAVIAEGKPVVIDLWAPWCGPCRMMGPVVDELAEEFAGKVVVCKMNVDDNEEVPALFNVMNIPTLLFFNNGQLVNRHVGAARKADLQPLFEGLL